MAREPAVVVVGADGSYIDVTDAALDIFGVSREAFLASRSSDWTDAEPDHPAGEALRQQWSEAGKPDLGGETTIVRGDGERRRVRFMITRRTESEYVAVLEPLPEAKDDATVVYTNANGVLAEWRAAERRLEAVPPDSAEWRATMAQIESLREQYHRLFDARRR